MDHIFLMSLLLGWVMTDRSLPIYGNSTLGYYYIEAFVGSPPQRKSLILDTGSHLTTFPCEGCTACTQHQNGIYQQSKSETFQRLKQDKEYFGWSCPYNTGKKCSFQMSYVEGSEYKGFFAIDSFLFQNEFPDQKDGQSYHHVFGCSMVETGDFYDQEVDGIIGFGVPLREKSSALPPTIIEIEFQEKRISSQTFSLCIAANGGRLNIGGPNSLLHLPKASSFSIDCSQMNWETQYQVYLSNISVA
jgi:hypothetical protein